MKFSEFKQAMKRHNELVSAFRHTGWTKKEWRDELRECDAVMDDFYMDNLYVLSADICFLTEKLKQFMSSKENQQLFTDVEFARMYKESGPVFAIGAKCSNKGYKGEYHAWYPIGKIFDGDSEPMSCVDLRYVLDIDYGTLTEIPGMEDFLWQVAEEDFNMRIEKQIGMLTRMRKKIEAKKAEVQQPDFVKKQVAKLEEKDKKAVKQIETLKAQLG